MLSDKKRMNNRRLGALCPPRAGDFAPPGPGTRDYVYAGDGTYKVLRKLPGAGGGKVIVGGPVAPRWGFALCRIAREALITVPLGPVETSGEWYARSRLGIRWGYRVIGLQGYRL